MNTEDIPNNIYQQYCDLFKLIATKHPDIAHVDDSFVRFFGPSTTELPTKIKNVPFRGDDGKKQAMMVLLPPRFDVFDPESHNYGVTGYGEVSILLKVKNDDYSAQILAVDECFQIALKIISYLKENRRQWGFLKQFNGDQANIECGAANPTYDQCYGANLMFPFKTIVNLDYNANDWLP